MGELQADRNLTLVFHGGKSGEGKSLLAQNLAAALNQQHPGRTLLVDLDPQARAEHQVRWALPSTPVLADIAGQLSRFDQNTIRGYFPLSATGVEVVTLADTETRAMEVTSQQMMRALALFREAYAYVIVDGLSGWDRLATDVLDACDRILIVASPDLSGLKQLRRDTLRYQDLKFPAAKLGLVLNRADLPHALQTQDLEKTLPGYRVLGSLPFDPHATEALNQHGSKEP